MRTPGLATRAALAAALSVCAALAAFSLTAYVIIRERAVDEVDRTLSTTAQRVAEDLSSPDDGSPEYTEVPTPGAAPAPTRSGVVLPPGTRARIDAEGAVAPSGPRTVTISGEPYRVSVTELPEASDGRRRTLTLARPLADVERTLEQVAIALGIVGAIAAILASILTFLIVRRALRPLRSARSAAERIAASEDLSLRVPEGRGDEVGVLARAMNRMLERLEAAQAGLRRALDEQRRFAADASHELRTPLTALRGDLELLARHDLPADERGEVVEEMRTSADRMDRLVRGLLSLARMDDAPPEPPERIGLAGFLGALVDRDEELHVTPGAEDLCVRGDTEALTAIVGNLVENARRHGTRVDVGLAAEGRWAVVTVQDDGPGVAPQDRERVFDRFYRAPGERRLPGTGLGLPIARAAAERLGGTLILADSARGARFEVRLPAERARSGARA